MEKKRYRIGRRKIMPKGYAEAQKMLSSLAEMFNEALKNSDLPDDERKRSQQVIDSLPKDDPEKLKAVMLAMQEDGKRAVAEMQERMSTITGVATYMTNHPRMSEIVLEYVPYVYVRFIRDIEDPENEKKGSVGFDVYIFVEIPGLEDAKDGDYVEALREIGWEYYEKAQATVMSKFPEDEGLNRLPYWVEREAINVRSVFVKWGIYGEAPPNFVEDICGVPTFPKPNSLRWLRKEGEDGDPTEDA